MNILIITAVQKEKDAILTALKKIPKSFLEKNNYNIDIKTTGLGPVTAAIITANILNSKTYDLVINTGIAGGFDLEIGTIVLAKNIVYADLGVQTLQGFIPLEKLGFKAANIKIKDNLIEKFKQILLTDNMLKNKIQIGTIATVATITGTKNRVLNLKKRLRNLKAEAMEGFGVALAAKIKKIPIIELRSVSNKVGIRDKSKWKIQEALNNLTLTFQNIIQNLEEIKNLRKIREANNGK